MLLYKVLIQVIQSVVFLLDQHITRDNTLLFTCEWFVYDLALH